MLSFSLPDIDLIAHLSLLFITTVYLISETVSNNQLYTSLLPNVLVVINTCDPATNLPERICTPT